MKLPNPLAATCLAVLAVLTMATTSLHGAGIDCTQAKTATDTAICQNKRLSDIDKSLSKVYGRLLLLPPALRKELIQSQKLWLVQRDLCKDQVSCLDDSYRKRIEALSVQSKFIVPYQPDDVDKAALAQLRSAVESAMQQDAQFPLEKAIDAFVIKSGTTDFSNQAAGGGIDAAPRFKGLRPQGVSPEEWAALARSAIETEGENGMGSYTLMDVDGDGLRDLVIDTYVGGTGLYNYISVAKRSGNRFTQDNAVYSLNGRGSNQEAYWVRLQGRVYAAYRNSHYGQDTVSLLRPLEVNGKVPALTIRYRYSLTVPAEQIMEQVDGNTGQAQKYNLDAVTLQGLRAAVAQVNRSTIHHAKNYVPSQAPLCPIPAGTSENDRQAYMGIGPGHYTFEIVADMPVWINKICHVAQLINWFGRYEAKNGLQATLWVLRPGQGQPDKQMTYQVQGRRQAVALQSGVAAFDGQ